MAGICSIKLLRGVALRWLATPSSPFITTKEKGAARLHPPNPGQMVFLKAERVSYLGLLHWRIYLARKLRGALEGKKKKRKEKDTITDHRQPAVVLALLRGGGSCPRCALEAWEVVERRSGGHEREGAKDIGSCHLWVSSTCPVLTRHHFLNGSPTKGPPPSTLVRAYPGTVLWAVGWWHFFPLTFLGQKGDLG